MFINDKRLRSLRHIVRSWLHDEPTPEASGVLEVARWHRLDGLPGINPDTNAMKIRVAMELGHQALAIEIDRVFRAAGVRYVTTKGVSLARRCGWPIGTRLGKDIDILVHHKDRFLAIDSLLDLGFVSSDGIRGLHEAFNIVYALGFRRGNNMVDLHWRLDSYLYPLKALTEVNFCDSALTIGNSRISIMTPELEFAYVVFHGAKHLWARWLWLVDLCMFRKAFGHEIAPNKEIETSLGVAHVLTLTLFDFPLINRSVDSNESKQAFRILNQYKVNDIKSTDPVLFPSWKSFAVNLTFTRSKFGRIKRIFAILVEPSVSDVLVLGRILPRKPFIYFIRPFRLSLKYVSYLLRHCHRLALRLSTSKDLKTR